MAVLVSAVLCIVPVSLAAEAPQAESDPPRLIGAGSPDGGVETLHSEPAQGVHWGAGAGGVLVRADAWDYAVLALARAFVRQENWDLGGSLILYLAVDPSSFAEGAALDADATNWVTRRYGWGVGAGVGWVNFTGRHPHAIWSGQALSAQALVKPVVLRFGAIEAALNLGAIEYFGWDWKPWAFLSCTFDG